MNTSSIPTAPFGGALIGAGAALLFRLYGRLAGVTGIVVWVTHGRTSERAWRATFAPGLLAGGIALVAIRPSAFEPSPSPMPLLILAGVAVGPGARLGAVFGRWDPTLAFVMAGAVGVHALLFRIISKRAAPVLVPTFDIPSKTAIDWPLLVGSAIFRFGWGASGCCPGPRILSPPTAAPGVRAYAAGTLLGIGAHGALFR